MNDTPLIFDIRHFSLDDGPGIRTIIFFKGCPLSCVWCQNPESIKSYAEIAFHAQLCIRCGRCTAACPEHAVTAGVIQRERCQSCGTCSKLCPSTALKKIGKFYSTDELVELLMEDRMFYDVSGGGVTFSGGEPAMHMDYLRDVLMKLKQRGVHISIQTSGMFQWSEFHQKLLPYLDLIFFDIKLYDRRKHLQYTGRSNERILRNFKVLCHHPTAKVIPTIPLIPGITATQANLRRIARLLKQTGCLTYELRPYNPGGIPKRTTLSGRERKYDDVGGSATADGARHGWGANTRSGLGPPAETPRSPPCRPIPKGPGHFGAGRRSPEGGKTASSIAPLRPPWPVPKSLRPTSSYLHLRPPRQEPPVGIPLKGMTMEEFDQIKQMFSVLLDQPISAVHRAATAVHDTVSSCSRKVVLQSRGNG